MWLNICTHVLYIVRVNARDVHCLCIQVHHVGVLARVVKRRSRLREGREGGRAAGSEGWWEGVAGKAEGGRGARKGEGGFDGG